ncbi:hypothetical protein DFJ73DRAFT_929473, partial [Zopfochytrium polystomum]
IPLVSSSHKLPPHPITHSYYLRFNHHKTRTPAVWTESRAKGSSTGREERAGEEEEPITTGTTGRQRSHLLVIKPLPPPCPPTTSPLTSTPLPTAAAAAAASAAVAAAMRPATRSSSPSTSGGSGAGVGGRQAVGIHHDKPPVGNPRLPQPTFHPTGGAVGGGGAGGLGAIVRPGDHYPQPPESAWNHHHHQHPAGPAPGGTSIQFSSYQFPPPAAGGGPPPASARTSISATTTRPLPPPALATGGGGGGGGSVAPPDSRRSSQYRTSFSHVDNSLYNAGGGAAPHPPDSRHESLVSRRSSEVYRFPPPAGGVGGGGMSSRRRSSIVTHFSQLAAAAGYPPAAAGTPNRRRSSFIIDAALQIGANSAPPVPAVLSRSASQNTNTETLGSAMDLQPLSDRYFRSPLYALIDRNTSSTRNQLAVSAAFFALNLLGLVVIVKCVFNVNIPGIWAFNLVHLVLSLLAKNLMANGTELAHVSAKALVAASLVKTRLGVPLSSVSYHFGKLNPANGRIPRAVLYASIIALEVVIWILQYQMEWYPVFTYAGTYPCIPAVYSNVTISEDQEPTAEDLRTYLSGTANFGSIYSYGLPLGDGLVGGYSAIPLAAPSNPFHIESRGVIYTVKVLCSTAVPVVPPRSWPVGAPTNKVLFRLDSNEIWSALVTSSITIYYPAWAHTDLENAARGLQQECSFLVQFRQADRIVYSYRADEWLRNDGGTIYEVAVGDAVIDRRMDDTVYAGLFLDPTLDTDPILAQSSPSTFLLPPATEQTLIAAVGRDVKKVFADATCDPLAPRSTCGILKWSARPDGAIDPTRSDKAVAAIAANIARRVLAEGMTFARDACRYSAETGAGYVGAPLWVENLVFLCVAVAAAVGSLMCLHYYVAVGSEVAAVDRAGRILEDPLRLLYAVRDGLAALVPKVAPPPPRPPRRRRRMSRMSAGAAAVVEEEDEDGDGDEDAAPRTRADWCSAARLKMHMEGILVRFGELKATRGDEVGRLVLDSVGNTVKMRKDREYE